VWVSNYIEIFDLPLRLLFKCQNFSQTNANIPTITHALLRPLAIAVAATLYIWRYNHRLLYCHLWITELLIRVGLFELNCSRQIKCYFRMLLGRVHNVGNMQSTDHVQRHTSLCDIKYFITPTAHIHPPFGQSRADSPELIFALISIRVANHVIHLELKKLVGWNEQNFSSRKREELQSLKHLMYYNSLY
jgi:hypothetical protein